jgi:hypothetical protein
MTDRLSEIVLGLQRMAENARLRGDDLRHIQHQESKEHAAWLSHQIAMVDEVRRVLEEEKRKFLDYFPELQQEQRREALPRAVTKGPINKAAE